MYSEMRKFWFWAHKVLPLTYDDSLSYYEFLCKVMAKLNECIDKINELGQELDSFETWTRNEFDAVRAEIAVVQANLEREIARVDGVLTDHGTRIGTLETNVSTLSTTVNGLVTTVNGLVTTVNTLGLAVTAIKGMIAREYDSTVYYVKGSYVIYNDKLYKASADTTGVWDSSKWDEIKIGVSLTSIESTLDMIYALLDDVMKTVAPVYHTNESYSANDYAYHAEMGGHTYLYRCKGSTTGAWDSSKWEQITVMDYLWDNISIAVLRDEYLDQAVRPSTSFSPSETYNAGDYVYNYNTAYTPNKIEFYRCLYNNTTGDWSSSDWVRVNPLDEIQSMKNELTLAYRIGDNNIRMWIAGDYSPSLTYNSGDFCYYQEALYKCLNDNTTGAWDSTKWNTVVLTSEIGRINTQLGGYTIAYMTQADYNALISAGTVDANTIYLTH